MKRLIIVIEDDDNVSPDYWKEFLAELNETLDNNFHQYYFEVGK